MKTLRLFGTAIIITISLLISQITPSYAAGPNVQSESQNIAPNKQEAELIRLVNIERTNRGLAPLKTNATLIAAARAHNEDMIAQGYFDHIAPDGSAPWDRACRQGYTPYGHGCVVGENLAVGHSSPSVVVKQWLDSPGHRAIMLDPAYREIGIGFGTGGSWGRYWTMLAGARPAVLPVFINNGAADTDTNDVTLTLTSEQISSAGSIGEITQIQISEDPSFSGVSWQSWSQDVSFTLSAGGGVKTVYIKFTDGTTEIVSEASIILSGGSSLVIGEQKLRFMLEAGSGKLVPSSIKLPLSSLGGEVNWSAIHTDWISLSQSNGQAPAEVDVSIDNLEQLLAKDGSIDGEITFTSDSEDTQSVKVTVEIVSEVHTVFLPMVIR